MIDITFAAASRLAELCPGLFTFIGTVGDFAALADMPRTVPAAYVVPLAERADDGDGADQSAQMHLATFAVLLVVRSAGDASGARGTQSLGPLRDAVHAALVGWQPGSDCTRVQFSNGALADSPAGGFVIWQDDFSVSRMVVRPAA